MLILTLSRRLLLSAFLLLFSLPVFSDIYWQMDGFGQFSGSPLSICNQYLEANTNPYMIPVLGSSTFILLGPTYGRCSYNYASYSNPDNKTLTADTPDLHRRGTSCPEGQEYSTESHTCTQPPSNCEPDMPFPARVPATLFRDANGRRWASVNLPEPPICYQSCLYNRSGDSSDDGSSHHAMQQKCYAKSGSETEGWCNRIYKSTGQECTTENYDIASSAGSDPLNSSDPTPPLVCGPNYVNSGGTCYPKPKPDPDSPAPPDGATDGNGNPPPTGGGGGNSGGSGNDGDGGNDSGGPSGGTGNTGDFDFAKGNKTPESGTSGQGDTLVGTDCNQPLVCTGDATSCAILYEQKVANCSLQWTPGIRAQVSDVFEGSDYELQEQTTGFAGALNQALAKGRFLPSSCPSPKTLTFFGKTYQLSWQPVCTFAVTIAPVLVALASLFFAIAIARAVRK